MVRLFTLTKLFFPQMWWTPQTISFVLHKPPQKDTSEIGFYETIIPTNFTQQNCSHTVLLSGTNHWLTCVNKFFLSFIVHQFLVPHILTISDQIGEENSSHWMYNLFNKWRSLTSRGCLSQFTAKKINEHLL